MLKDFKVLSRFIQKWIQPPACTVCRYRIFFSYWLAHFYLMKNPLSAGLFWFGLQQKVSDGTRSLSIIHVHCRLCTNSTVPYIIGAIPGCLLCGQILLSSLRSVQLEISCAQCNYCRYWSPQKTVFQISKIRKLELTSAPDPWHFYMDPDPRIRTTELRIRIRLFYSVTFKV